jgi:diphthamide biosynthesis protein 2
MQKVKEAQTVGILAGTLGVANYLQMVERIKALCKATQKEFHLFLMGKLNPAKLANFTEVDVYVLIACPENALVRRTDEVGGGGEGNIHIRSRASCESVGNHCRVAPLLVQLDSHDFFKPVVTPFEFEMAVSPARQWSGTYHLGFEQILSGLATNGRPLVPEGAGSRCWGHTRRYSALFGSHG